MKRTVDVGARIRDHLDFANLELGTGRILCSRCLTTEPVTDDRGRESLIRDHTVLDSVTDIDQPFWHQRLSCQAITFPELMPAFVRYTQPVFDGVDAICSAAGTT